MSRALGTARASSSGLVVGGGHVDIRFVTIVSGWLVFGSAGAGVFMASFTAAHCSTPFMAM